MSLFCYLSVLDPVRMVLDLAKVLYTFFIMVVGVKIDKLRHGLLHRGGAT